MNLAGKTNAQVADVFQYLFIRNGKNAAAGGPVKVDAQVMALALATYVTSTNLAGGNYAASYGFHTSVDGIAYAKFDVYSELTAQETTDLGLTPTVTPPSGCVGAHGYVTIIDILISADNLSRNGLLYDADGNHVVSTAELRLRTLANELFTEINEGND